jgi:G3E family GTPase
LRNTQGYKIAVIENEFGEEGVDGELVESSVEEIIEIQNGCMCCTVRGDFIAGVQKLLDSGKDFDYLIIEASGMSEPLPIAQTFLIEDFGGRCKLDSIVCLVDATNFRHNLVQSLQTTFEQIEFANFVILNKVEGVSAEEIEAIKKTIKELNQYCVIVETNFGVVDMRYILDTTSFEMTTEIEQELSESHKHEHDHSISNYLFKTTQKCYSLENMKHFL